MPESDSAAVEWIIANTINETARGDPHALASRIVAALAAAGFLIVRPKLYGGGAAEELVGEAIADRRTGFPGLQKDFPKLPPDQERE